MTAGFHEQTVRAERQQALRALLQTPLLIGGGEHDEDLQLIRRHAEWLRGWLGHNAGWAFHLQADVARLYKFPAALDDESRGLRDPRTEAAFTRNRYVLLCLALAVLERSERQTTLGRLAQELGALAASDPQLEAGGFRFDLTMRAWRSDLVAVIRYLLELRILVRIQGDELQFLAERGDVLYNINRSALALILAVRRAPSTIDTDDADERLEALALDAWNETEEGKHQRLRWTLTRRLLDDPVLYYEDLDAEARAYLQSQRSLITGQIAEATGLVLEVRQEGLAMVDPEQTLSDLALPQEGTDGHILLLLAEFLAAHVRQSPDQPIGYAALEQHVAGLIEQYRKYWRQDVGEAGAEVILCRDALQRLAALRLVRLEADRVVPHAAVARYAATMAARGEAVA